MKYRAEIDGLRTLAIVPVVFFHAGIKIFSGGFVGVDIFFVISGYLITSLLIEDIQAGKFSLLSFYERRARRILPALFFVMGCIVPFAFLWLHPPQYLDFSKALIAVSLFISNVLFWQESGYFAPAAEENPLLHTWSLAVEEQYYIFFPLLLILLWRFGRGPLFWTIAGLSLLSLYTADWGTRNEPAANFFFTPSRVWELFVGSLTALIINKRGVADNNFLSLAGLAAIGIAIFLYDAQTPFPGLYTLLPVIGTVLLILYAGSETFVARLLSLRLMVALGLISYSAYLWHQPLFAFARVLATDELRVELMLGLSVLAFGLAALSWRYVERPFRDRSRFSRGHIFALSGLGIAVFVVLGTVGVQTNGLQRAMFQLKYDGPTQARFQTVQASVDYNIYDHMVARDCNRWARDAGGIDPKWLRECQAQFGPATVVLGDSHAMNLYNIFAKSKQRDFVIGLAQGGCRPHNNRPHCHYDGFETFLSANPGVVGEIFYHQSGSYFIRDSFGNLDSPMAFQGGFGSFDDKIISSVAGYLSDLETRAQVPVTWIGPFPEYRHDPRADYVFGDSGDEMNAESQRIFAALEIHIEAKTTDLGYSGYLAFETLFDPPKQALIDGCFVFRDIDHYSRCGEALLAKSSRFGAFLGN